MIFGRVSLALACPFSSFHLTFLPPQILSPYLIFVHVRMFLCNPTQHIMIFRKGVQHLIIEFFKKFSLILIKLPYIIVVKHLLHSNISYRVSCQQLHLINRLDHQKLNVKWRQQQNILLPACYMAVFDIHSLHCVYQSNIFLSN